MKGDLWRSFSVGQVKARLGQPWSIVSTRGLSIFSSKQVVVLVGKAFFLPPRVWKRLYLPIKTQMRGGTNVAITLQKEELIVGLSITKAGQLRGNVHNSTDQVIYLTPKTIRANSGQNNCKSSSWVRFQRLFASKKRNLGLWGETVRKLLKNIPKLATSALILSMISWLNWAEAKWENPPE